MKTLKIEALLRIDDELMYGDDKDGKDWFFNTILKQKQIVHNNDIGDEVGTLKILKINEKKETK